jgi:hypothetical protein
VPYRKPGTLGNLGNLGDLGNLGNLGKLGLPRPSLSSLSKGTYPMIAGAIKGFHQRIPSKDSIKGFHQGNSLIRAGPKKHTATVRDSMRKKLFHKNKGKIMVILSDLIQRDQFKREVLLTSLRKSVFATTGVIVPDASLSELISANVGKFADFDYFLDLADNEARISDDSNTTAGTDGIQTSTDRAVFNYRNRSWGAKNITASLSTTGDPLTVIAGRIGAYWARQIDITTMAIVEGIVAGNIANDGSDMVNDQSGSSVNLDMFVDTKQTAGDAQDELFGAIVMHSAIRASLIKQSLLDRIYDDNGNFLYDALLGLKVIVNDNVGNAGGVYDSYIIGGGFIAYGEGTPKEPLELERNAATGNGAGETTLWSRKNFALHPKGFSFVGTVASTSPTNAEFADAGAWQRNVDRKRVPFAVLKSQA